jgi:hypothetical protein
MHRFWIILSFASLALVSTTTQGQPICRDGTTSTASGRGACSHHQGVARPATPKPSATRGNSGDIVLPTTSEPRAGATSSTRISDSSRRSDQASGGKVWVNTKSGVYHCPGTRWYGATKSGEYVTESQARAAGDRPAYGRACS